MASEKAQKLCDEFNRKYWSAMSSAEPVELLTEAALLARQLVVELGRQNLIHDKLLDPEYPNKYTLEKL